MTEESKQRTFIWVTPVLIEQRGILKKYRWEVFLQGEKVESKQDLPTQKSAIAFARKLAKIHEPSEIVLRNTRNIENRWTYPRSSDPVRRPG